MVKFTSPVFGDSFKIQTKNEFGSSKHALRDLKHVETQIRDLSVMPDFGYGTDNYLIKEEFPNKWDLLCGLIGDNKRFAWLMNYLMLDKLEKQVQKDEVSKTMLKAMREKLRKERKVKFAADEDLRFQVPKETVGKAEMREILHMFKQS
jgi:fructosamine-3-kinase